MIGDFYAISNLVVAILIDMLGIFVYAQNTTASANRRFVVFCAGFSAWMYSLFLLYYFGKEPISAMIWSKSIYIGACFASVLSYHFFIRFLDVKRNPRILYLLYFLSVVFLILTYADKLLGGLYSYSWGYYPKYGQYHPLFMVFLLTANIYALSTLYHKYQQRKELTGQEFQRLKYVLSAWIMAASAAVNFLPTYGFNIFPMGNFFTLVMVLLLSYAILRHQLLDIEVIIKKTLVFAGLLASVFAMLILPTLIIQEYLLRSAGATAKLIGLTISGIFIILTMRRIETFLINITDKYLFQKKYDYKALLKTFTGEVLTVLELDKLVNMTVDKLSDIVKLQSAAVLLFDDEKQQFNVAASQGIQDPSVTLIRPDGIVTFMDETHGYIQVNELKKHNVSIPATIQEIIGKLNAELIIPMVIHEEVIGVLSLGKKKSDEEFTQDDLDILLPLAKTLAIAVSNAQLFDELGKTQAEAAQKEKMAVIGTLAAGMAHEIRNPISTIKIFSDYLDEKIDDGAFRTKYKEIVVKEVDRIDHIIQTMIDFSGDTATVKREEVSIEEAVDDVINSTSIIASAKGRIRFAKEVPSGLSNLRVDRKDLDEILFNLTQNAINAIDENGTITFSAREDADTVEISVRDTGCGMSAEVLKNIFNPFFTTRAGGFGLGLFIVNELVRRNGGSISVESKEGRGAIFTMKFKMIQPLSNVV